MNEHFISLAHGTNALDRITVANLFYTPTESIPLFWQVCESCYLYQYLSYCRTKKSLKNPQTQKKEGKKKKRKNVLC